MSERMDLLRRAMQALEGRDRLLLVLTRIEGLHQEEIAEVLGDTPERVGGWLVSAEQRLAGLLTEVAAGRVAGRAP